MVWVPPKTCPAGHPLAVGNVIRSFAACECSKALGSPLGHDQVRCLTCDRVVRENGCDDLVDDRPPERRGTGSPGDPGYPGLAPA